MPGRVKPTRRLRTAVDGNDRRGSTRLRTGRYEAYIVRRAADHDSRVVTLGPLVLFSAQSGDAWMLDPEDGLAVCLAKSGTPLPVEIAETQQSFQIRWNVKYRIEGDMFVYLDAEGGEAAIVGYPTAEIVRASSLIPR